MRILLIIALVCLATFPYATQAQGTNYARVPDTGIDWTTRPISIARYWNEAILFSIRRDLARPVVHARNLYHLSAAMWDGWAAYSTSGEQLFFKERVSTSGWTQQKIELARNQTITFAAYKLLKYRYKFVPQQNFRLIQTELDNRMLALGHPLNWTITPENKNDPRSLGVRIADLMISECKDDGAYELNDYESASYFPVNPPLAPTLIDSIQFVVNPNRWQSIALGAFVDQNGISLKDFPPFTGPHWGKLPPFGLSVTEKTVDKPGVWYNLPGPAQLPWNMDNYNVDGEDKTSAPMTQDGEWYKANHTFVVEASSFLDPDDGVMIDISPASVGNNDLGTNNGKGYKVNPVTGKPYEPQMVLRGDYYRVLAEFWADGPFSEAPPGHWNVLLNYVTEHPLFERRWQGKGDILDPLEWDVRCYLTMNGAMHDAAIAAWGAKGYFDSARPITAIRFMARKGQATSPVLPRYNKYGFNLRPGLVEQITFNTTAPGGRHENLAGKEGKIAIYAWRGPKFINATSKGYAGVGWIPAEEWWPYQRPNFVTPPFAGYVSGHSTYSRAAAEVMTSLTGSPYFPGGMSRFLAPKNNFLVFEKGPSMDIELQWATYYDAADECSISRIYGGIHPRMDDIPGRFMGHEIGLKAVSRANQVFGVGQFTTAQIIVGVFASLVVLLLIIGGGVFACRKFKPLLHNPTFLKMLPGQKYTPAVSDEMDAELGEMEVEDLNESEEKSESNVSLESSSQI